MQTATQDCTALWKQFLPWMLHVHGHETCAYACPSFGLAMDTDMQTGLFTYWAAIEVQDSFADASLWPSGFSTICLPAGPYVGTTVASLSKLSEAYTCMYGPWAQANPAHALDYSGICFEYYDERYLKNGSLDVFAPVRAK